MKPGARQRVITVDEAVREAASSVDPEHASEGAAALVLAFEDDERPATAAEDLAGELRSAAREIDPDGLDPPVSIAAAAALWLATNPADEDQPERTIREGCRLFFAEDGAPPSVAEWLADRGLD